MDLVGGQALQQILEHRIVRCAPKRAVELDVGGQPGGITRLGKCAVAVNQGLQAHQVHFGAHRGGFLGGLAFVQQAGQGFAHRGAGHAKAFGQSNLAQGVSGLECALQQVVLELGMNCAVH